MLPPWMCAGACLSGGPCCFAELIAKESLVAPTFHTLCVLGQQKDGRHDQYDFSEGRRRMANFLVYSTAKAQCPLYKQIAIYVHKA